MSLSSGKSVVARPFSRWVVRREDRPLRRPRPTIGQVLHTLDVGGAEVLAARLARQLGGPYRFVFFCLDGLGPLGEELRRVGCQVEVLQRRPGVDPQCIFRLANLFRREQVAVVHTHQYTPFFYAAAARLLHQRPAILLTEHGRHYPDYPRPKRQVINRLLLWRRDRVVAVGEAVRTALIANDGFPSNRVGVIYNGIDLAPFAAATDTRGTVRKELGLDNKDFIIAQVARLDYLKDHATALRAMDLVRRRRPTARLALIGEGPELGPIQRMIQELDLAAHVRLLGLRRDIARVLPAADLFLLSSISEGIPLTVIEAMVARLPVVCTRVGGVPEVVEEGSTGLLAPSGDHADLAEKICQLAGNPDLRLAMGLRGRERAMSFFSEQRMQEQYGRLYEEMLADGK
jgi:glycosyltransferase involved in cell wall biosynthesis